MAAVERLSSWGSLVSPTCRCHYGGILIAVGQWEEAEQELLAGIGAFEKSYKRERLFPLVRLADLRVRQGRFEEAERLSIGGLSITIDDQFADGDRSRLASPSAAPTTVS